MATSKPIQLQISDIVQWFRADELVINETFQRHSVWTPSAKTFLIDTILNELPIPKLYIRTTIDPKTQRSVREVVDGQQRVRTFVDFADDKLKLTTRSDEFAGERYTSLAEELQSKFLSYVVTVEQLLNASDDDVIDIFARLNSYTVALNGAEKRHAKFQTNFKFAVRKASQEMRGFFEKYKVFTTKRRFRMADDVFMAGVFGVFLEGVVDGGDANLNRLYKEQDDETFTESIHRQVLSKVRRAFKYLDKELGIMLTGPLSRHYQLLMLIAAYAHHEFGIPKGQIDKMPDRGKLANSEVVCDRLTAIVDGIEAESPPPRLAKFAEASGERPERIASRGVRFPVFVKALAK